MNAKYLAASVLSALITASPAVHALPEEATSSDNPNLDPSIQEDVGVDPNVLMSMGEFAPGEDSVDFEQMAVSLAKAKKPPRGRSGSSFTWGNTTHYSRGGSSFTWGDSTYYSRGGNSFSWGDSTYYSRGGSSFTWGDSTYYSRGGSSFTWGDTTYYSRGGSCFTWGSSQYCS